MNIERPKRDEHWFFLNGQQNRDPFTLYQIDSTVQQIMDLGDSINCVEIQFLPNSTCQALVKVLDIVKKHKVPHYYLIENQFYVCNLVFFVGRAPVFSLRSK